MNFLLNLSFKEVADKTVANVDRLNDLIFKAVKV